MEPNSVATVNLSPERESSLRTVGHISYALHAIVAVAAVLPGAQVTVFLLVAAFILDLVKRGDAAGSWQESHFRWRIRSVIWAAVLYVVTFPLWLLLLLPRLDRLGGGLDLVPVSGGARLAGAERPQTDADAELGACRAHRSELHLLQDRRRTDPGEEGL